MKKIIKWGGITLLAILILLITLPFLFKDKIVAKVKEETNKSINAKVDFGEFDLSLIRNFPNFSLRVNNLSVINIEPIEGDTLVYAKQLDLTIDIMSVIKGGTIGIKKVSINSPVMYFLVNEKGKSNWDIAKPSAKQATNNEPSTFKASLKEYSISNGLIVYNDKTMPFFLKLDNVNHTGSGDFTQDLFLLKTKTLVEHGDMTYGGLQYISQAKAEIDAEIEINLKTMRFTFKDNKIKLNELFLNFSGWVMMPDTNIDMDLKYSATKSEFKNFISMVPAVFTPQFKDLKSSGTMSLDGSIKGRYNSKSMPGFGLKLKVDKGMFQYPSLPTAINNVNIDLNISNPDGIPDHTIIDLSKLHVEINNDPFDAKLYLATPVSDPAIDAFMKGKIDLDKIQKLVPLEKGTELQGIVTADLNAKGKLSSIKQKKYEQFNASGNLSITGLKYNAPNSKSKVDVSLMKLGFNPSKVSLDAFNSKIGKSDFSATGSLENFIAYALKNETLVGTLNLNSNLIDLNEFMSGEQTASGNVDTTSMKVLQIPTNINFILSADIKKLIYQNLSIDQVSGKLEVKDQAISMKDIFMRMMDGTIKMSGKYSAININKPEFDMSLAISDFDISKTSKNFISVEKLAPITKNCSGSFSTTMTVRGDLDQKMAPVMNTLTGSGKLSTSTVVVDNFPAFVKIADVLKLSSWKSLNVPPINPSFKFVNGRVFVDPFDVTINGIKSSIGGSNGFDETIDYVMATQIPRSAIGGGANNLISGLLSSANSKGANVSIGDIIPINLTIKGTVNSPKIGTDLGKIGSNVMNDLKSKAEEEFNKKKAEAESKIKDATDKIKSDAEAKFNSEKEKATAEAERIKRENEAKAKAYTDSLKREAERKAKDQLKNLNPFKK